MCNVAHSKVGSREIQDWHSCGEFPPSKAAILKEDFRYRRRKGKRNEGNKEATYGRICGGKVSNVNTFKVFNWIFWLAVTVNLNFGGRVWLHQEGDLYPTSHLWHVSIRIELGELLGHCDGYQSSINHLRFHEARDLAATVDYTNVMLLDKAKTDLAEACKNLKGLLLGDEKWTAHAKRQAIALAMAAGAFAYHEIEQWFIGDDDDTEARLDAHDKRLDEVVKTLNENSDMISGLTAHLEAVSKVHSWELKVNFVVHSVDLFVQTAKRLLDGVEAAREGRVTGNLLPVEAVRNVRLLAHKQKQNIPVDAAWQIYQFPCSLGHSSSGLALVIHCPVVHDKMRLMWLNHAPALIDHNATSANMMEIVGQGDRFIAINDNSKEYTEGFAKELRMCKKIQKATFCKHLVIRTQPGETCLSAIAFNQQKQMRQMCDWRKAERTWAVAPAGGNSYDIATLEPLGATVECKDNRPIRSSELKPGWTLNVTVEPGCEMKTSKFRLFGRPEQSWSAKRVVQFGEGLLTELKEVEAEESKPEDLQKIRERLQNRPPLTESEDQPWYLDRWTHHGAQYGGLLMLVGIMLSVAGVLYWRRRRARASGQVPTEWRYRSDPEPVVHFSSAIPTGGSLRVERERASMFPERGGSLRGTRV
jgi:hypothetical protein